MTYVPHTTRISNLECEKLKYGYVTHFSFRSIAGVLICFSFVLKKHVFPLYKQRFMAATHPEAEASGAEPQAGCSQDP